MELRMVNANTLRMFTINFIRVQENDHGR
jgi:hypothetical protein